MTKSLRKSYIKYPVAYNFTSKEIVPIGDVTNENKVNLFCPDCKINLIPVINHQTPHFKHKPNSSCSGSLETYLHWLAKEIFKQVEEIEIPELLIDDLPEKQRQKFQYKYNSIIDPNVPETFRSTFKKGLKKNLSESKKLLIDKTEVEKEFESKLGNIRVDIVIFTQNRHIFIEPFFTNPIDGEKKKKLSLIDIPTLSLDLSKFINSFGHNYSIELLKKYLTSKESKKWVYLSNQVLDKHIKNYENYLFNKIEKNQGLIKSHKSKLNKISTLELECQKRYEKIRHLKEEVVNLGNEISDLKNELEIYY